MTLSQTKCCSAEAFQSQNAPLMGLLVMVPELIRTMMVSPPLAPHCKYSNYCNGFSLA